MTIVDAKRDQHASSDQSTSGDLGEFGSVLAQDFRTLVALSSDIIWETNVQGTLTSVSGRFREHQNIDVRTQIGWELIEASKNKRIQSAIEAKRPFRDQSIEVEIDGQVLFLRLSGLPRYSEDGDFLGYRGVGVDITDDTRRRQAFAELAEQNRYLVSAIEASPLCITIADARQKDLPLIYINPAFTKLTGYRLAEVYGRNCRFLQGPETEPEAVAALHHAIENRASVEVDLTNYHKDGSEFMSRVSLAPVFGTDGQLQAYIGHQRNRSDELAVEATERLQSRLISLGELASGIAHEINNLLQPAMMGPDLLARRIPQDDERAHRIVERIKVSTTRARDVLQAILTFARTDKPNLELLEIRDEVKSAVDFLTGVLPPGIKTVLTGFNQPVGTAMLNSTQVVQVIANLMTNAAHAMGQSGTLEVELERIEVSAKQATSLSIQPREYAVIRVHDSGPGIDPKVQMSIFDPMFTTKPEGEGTGLGLSIVYGITQNWGGIITVESELGNGATFTVYIPTAD